MDIRKIFNIIKRWVWLLILGGVLAGVGGYIVSSRQTPVYQASTRFVVLRAAQTTYDYYSYVDSQQLISTYAQLLSTESLLQRASEVLGFPVRKGQATAQQVGETQFVELTVKDTDPAKAAAIANGLIEVLIEQNEQLQSVRYISAEENIQNRINQAETQIAILQAQIDQISTATVEDQIAQVQAQMNVLQPQISDLEYKISQIDPLFATNEQKLQRFDYQATLDQLKPVMALYQQIYTNLVVLGQPSETGVTTSTQLDQLKTTLNLYEQIYISSISSLESVRLTRAQNTPNVVQVEVATVPSSPISPKPMQTASLAATVGLLLAAGFVFLVEYLDDTVKTPDEVKELLGLPVIGLVGELPATGNGNKHQKTGMHVANQPRSPVAEAFRSLRTNLEFSSIDHPLHVIIVTSPGPGEGKTTIAANLAIALAQSGRKVLLLDADLRRPNVHQQFDIPNRIGLSDLVRSKLDIADVTQKTEAVRNLSIITSGSLPPNPAELLGSERMRNLLEELKQYFDMIVIDAPPLLVADPQILCGLSDGMIYVIRPGKTRALAAKIPLEELERINIKLLGVVMNRIPKNRGYYYGGFEYYSPYAHSSTYHHNELVTNDYEAIEPKQ